MQLEDAIRFDPRIERILIKMPVDTRPKCTIRKFPPQSGIVRKSYDCKYVYILLKGEVKVINEFENGTTYTIASMVPINFIGELEALSGQSVYALTVKTITDCITLRLPFQDFIKWLESDAVMLMMIAKVLAKKMYPTSYESGNPTNHSSLFKLQSYLVEYYQKNAIQRDQPLPVKKNRQYIADEIGISVKSVNRSLEKLKEQGLVTVEKGKVHLSKEQYLEMTSLISASMNKLMIYDSIQGAISFLC
jgi:CRP/FNR family cyclic AMP-dependent transcriptional regulator